MSAGEGAGRAADAALAEFPPVLGARLAGAALRVLRARDLAEGADALPAALRGADAVLLTVGDIRACLHDPALARLFARMNAAGWHEIARVALAGREGEDRVLVLFERLPARPAPARLMAHLRHAVRACRRYLAGR